MSRALVAERLWPDSTRPISELRVTIEYESAGFFARRLGSGKLHLDIVDYPGEWLLDLPLLDKDYRDLVARPSHWRPFRAPRRPRPRPGWRLSPTLDPAARSTRDGARARRQLFTAYLRACQTADEHALSTLPPGPLPDARRPGRLARPHLRPARPRPRRRRRLRHARRHDGAPLRGLQGASSCAPSSATTSPGSTGRSCWSTRCRRSMPGPAAGADLDQALSGILDCFPRRPRQPPGRPSSPAASTASCSPPPRPTTCTVPATTGWSASCAASSATPSSAPPSPAPRSTWSHSPPCAPPARPRSSRGARSCRSSSACRCRARDRRRELRRRVRNRHISRRLAGKSRIFRC